MFTYLAVFSLGFISSFFINQYLLYIISFINDIYRATNKYYIHLKNKYSPTIIIDADLIKHVPCELRDFLCSSFNEYTNIKHNSLKLRFYKKGNIRRLIFLINNENISVNIVPFFTTPLIQADILLDNDSKYDGLELCNLFYTYNKSVINEYIVLIYLNLCQILYSHQLYDFSGFPKELIDFLEKTDIYRIIGIDIMDCLGNTNTYMTLSSKIESSDESISEYSNTSTNNDYIDDDDDIPVNIDKTD